MECEPSRNATIQPTSLWSCRESPEFFIWRIIQLDTNMNDRLAELKRGVPEVDHSNIDVATGADSLLPKDFMQDFFGNVELVKQNIMAIRQATKRIGQINQDVILASTSEKESELSAELTPLIADTNKKAAFSKQLLQRCFNYSFLVTLIISSLDWVKKQTHWVMVMRSCLNFESGKTWCLP
jgi:hypothetical protein